jgi:SAM-dependent methyltransferase
MSTLDYYDHNAAVFDERTRGNDIRPRMQPFIDLLPRAASRAARILDVGCGPGREVQSFRKLGFDAMGIDGSQAMIDLARTITPDARFERIAFHEIAFDNEFDGIWASASLLHVPADQIDDVMNRLARALRMGGVLYMSVKQGDGARIHEDGRFFNDYSDVSLRELFARHPRFDLISIETSPPGETQSDRKSWLHALARKRR